MRRVGSGSIVRHEAEVIVAMWLLLGAARIDHVGLRRDLVARAEPGVGDQSEHLVVVVPDEELWISDGQLLQCVPHTIVVAGTGEMIAAADSTQSLVDDDLVEDARDGFDDGSFECIAEHDDARAAEQGISEFGHHRQAPFRGGNGVAEHLAVIDNRVLLDHDRPGILVDQRPLPAERDQVVEIALRSIEPVAAHLRNVAAPAH